MSFTENRFPETISQGSSGGPSFSTDVIVTKSGFEVRNINWSEELNKYQALHENMTASEFEAVLLFHKSMRGRAYGFRFKDWGDYKSCSILEDPTPTDQTIGAGDGSTATFQLVKVDDNGFAYSRDIKKPVSGTVLISIDDVAFISGWAVDTTTGIVTFTDETTTVTNATDNGDGTTRIATSPDANLTAGESVYLSGFTGDWAALNGTRYAVEFVAPAQFDIDVDSSSFAVYSSNGGQTDTIPQSGETVKAGFEFDVPCRFDSDDMISSWDNYLNFGFDLPIIEIKL